uniref:Xylanolytic transcriptional activator regulatory domain-containing protein n=1 Tax=Bionectria ochroleuca TaxID=29856 RepID=A0A8H7NBC4_BIOOC
MELFSHFKSRFYPFQPAFYDVDYIESVVSSLIGGAGQAPKVTKHFLCLFHAILAAGAQFSDRPVEQRSKLFHKHLRHALKHFGTFEVVLNPTIEMIQGLIVISQILQNDVNPRGAWILSGITIRSAICLGVHKKGPRPESSQLSSGDAAKLRMAIVWQDTLLSMAFGRTPSSHEMYHETDLPPLWQHGSEPAGLTYRQAMNWICHASMKYFVVPASPPDSAVYNDIFRTFAEIQASCAKHIRERSQCRSLLEVQEYYSFILHRNFGISFLCRPILSRQGRQKINPQDASDILSRVLEALKQSATAFISLRSISKYSTRSWAFLHNGLCSALMLGFIEQTKGLEETKDIQTQLIASLETSQEIKGGSLSNAYQKALCALKAQRKLADEPNLTRTTEPGQVAPGPFSVLSPSIENPQFQNNLLDPTDLSSFDMDEWVRSVDFGSYSPLEAYDFIMSDQFAPGSLF